MNKQLVSLVVSAIIVSPLAFVPNVFAQNGQDPKDRECDQDAQTLTSISGGTFRTLTNWSGIDVRVELRKSDRCQANWVRANVPQGTVLYLKDEEGRTYYPYTAQVNGWNYGDMMPWNRPYSACAKLPDGREFCTSAV